MYSLLNYFLTKLKSSLVSPLIPLFFLCIFFIPTSAEAARIINSATLNGASSVSVTSSQNITVAISVTTNGTSTANDWQSTKWTLSDGSTGCFNNLDHNSVGTYSETFTVTAPSNSGTYTISFIAYNNNTCSTGASTTFSLNNSITVIPTPEIDIRGNSVSISSGDSTPTISDYTDFGTVNINSTTFDRVFTIHNTGSASLSLGNVIVSGTHASDFTVVNQPAGSVLANSSTSFTIRFDPSAIGVRNAILAISNNDSNENPYTFSIRGTGATPILSISPSTRTITEGDTGTADITYNVLLNITSPIAITVNYTVSGSGANQATTGVDFANTSGTLTFNPNELSKSIIVPIIGDTIYEPNETFTVTLSNPTNATIATATATGTITNDDAQPSFSIADVIINEGSSGIYTKKIPVLLTNPQITPLSVNYTINNGTATLGSDYNVSSTTGTLTFSGTQTIQNISVDIFGDTTQEGDETFTITISGATGGATISDSSATITLVNDDGAIKTGGRNFLIRNPINTQNIKGNIKVVGNTVLCYKVGGVCSDTNSANNQVSLSFIDTSATTHTFNNSSQAQIAGIPSTAKVVWAGFYTQGYMKKNYTDTTTALNATPAYLITPLGTSIAVTPDVIDVYAYQTDQYTYSTFSEVSSLKGLSGSEINGYFTGANIKAREGDDDGALGYFGAWTLVVVYEDSTESLKNISVFDGYKQVGDSTENIAISGFLTPTSGSVKSTVSVFVGEGDKSITGDTISLNSVKLPNATSDNAFNSTVNGFNPNPNPINFQGIDIHNYDVGVDGDISHQQIIGNGEQSATVTLFSDGDYYYPSMVAFTTELYEPRVCYVESYYDTNGQILSNPNIGDTVLIKTWIANMKKDATDGNLETAEKVEITMELDDINLQYKTGTTAIKNIGESVDSNKTDAQGDDIADYFADKNTSVWRIGTGANSLDGGDLLPNADNSATNKVYISFKTELLTSGNISLANLYKVSYENSNMGLRIGDESPVNIGICKDFNSTIVVNAPLGVFNVVNSNFTGNTGSTISTDSKHADNALYTQASNQAFNVKVLALNADFTTLKAYTGDVNLSLITTPDYTANESEAQKQAKCDASTGLTSLQTVPFSNQSVKDLSLTYPSAYRNVAFKITYNDNGTTKHVCSRDSFSIRPETYTLTPSSTPLVGGRTYSLAINALGSGGGVATGYDQIMNNTSDKNASLDLSIPAGCTLPASNTPLANFTFINGVVTYNPFIYPNVGDVNVTILDNDWTKIDQTSFNTKGYDDCIVGSTSITPVNGKIGCLLKKVQPFVFSPKAFINTLNVMNFNNALFTYIAEDGTMSADATLTATAILDDNITTATNYTAGCFAKNVTYNITMLNNPTTWLNGGGITDAIHRVRYFENETSSNFESNATGSATFSSTEGNFTSGIAPLTMRFNFTRAINSLDEPFKVLKNDFNISIQDTNGTIGTDFNRTLNPDQNATFYYGRVHVPDITINDNFADNVRVYYEVYSRARTSAERTLFDINGSESVDSINWYNNTLHTPGHMQLVDNNYTAISGTNSSGAQALSIDLTAPKVPHKDKIQIHGPIWLIQNPTSATATTNDFLVEFTTGATNWAGQGTLGRTIDDTNTSVAKKSNKRIEW